MFSSDSANGSTDPKKRLQSYLQDSLFRQREGFPHGSSGDILALSDPPHFTLCPNPFLQEFLAERSNGLDSTYHRQPYRKNVAEGKNDTLYRAHSYHTKIPYKAIMHYILHYTEPGDVVLDGFAGSGMTGLAAQLCQDARVVASLGYQVDEKGTIRTKEGDFVSQLGPRWAILNDLSPAATFISYHYNRPDRDFAPQARELLREVKAQVGWMYETRHRDGQTKGWINYVIWSDVFTCPVCKEELVFWEEAVDANSRRILQSFPCKGCGSSLSKRALVPVLEEKYDEALGQYVTQAKQVPVLINYSVQGQRYEKVPDAEDLQLLGAIEAWECPYWYPTDPLPAGYSTRQPQRSHGLTHIHHFYYKRAVVTLAAFAQLAREKCIDALWLITAVAEGASRLNRERPWGMPSKLSGTLYVSSLTREINVLDFIERKIQRYPQSGLDTSHVFCQCGSTTDLGLPDLSVDYIFTDPPFGGNIMYSELNFLWEAWLRVFTNNGPEAIENAMQGKGREEYRDLMTRCFREYYRVLKPGRWITIVFHNSHNEVWHVLQQALKEAGFIIADVSVLDKKQGSFKQVTGERVLKENLVVSAQKPWEGALSARELERKEAPWVWQVVDAYLARLPVYKEGEQLADDPQRKPQRIYDQLVAYCLERNIIVPMSVREFYTGLEERYYREKDMYFLSSPGEGA